MFESVLQFFQSGKRDAQLQERLAELRQKVPVPVFWLFGKTQSGKSTLIKFLTGADEAEIGQGFQPCTRFSRQYQFPTQEAPLLTFLDTRGLDEPGYDADVDLASFNQQAHVVLVVVKALDHAQENVIKELRKVRAAAPERPVVLVLTCLHEAYPQQQHPTPYPWPHDTADWQPAVPEGQLPQAGFPTGFPDLVASLKEQTRRFGGLVDRMVAVDITRPEEGFNEPEYGGERLKQVLVEVLPHAYRQTLLSLNEATKNLQDIYARAALPHIIGYSTLAATAGAFPVPWIDLLVLPGIQTQMIYQLARLYGQPLTGQRFLEMAGSLGMGIMVRQAARELMKVIPVVGSVAGGALAAASTFALGKAFCYYYRAVHQGQVPKVEELRQYYNEQLTLAERSWQNIGKKAAKENP